jgi:hypothetical protein
MQNKTKRRRMERGACIAPQPKQTHKLEPQTCVVWVPDVPGYAANFGPGIFQVASHPEFAYHLTEDEAEDLAMALRVQLGIKAAIRPYYAQAQG